MWICKICAGANHVLMISIVTAEGTFSPRMVTCGGVRRYGIQRNFLVVNEEVIQGGWTFENNTG